MYTTPVQSGQYKFNSVLSLAGMKVSSVFFKSKPSFLVSIDASYIYLDFIPSQLSYFGSCSKNTGPKWLFFKLLTFCLLVPGVLQVSKPSQEAYQNELNIESVERSFILSARSAVKLFICRLYPLFVAVVDDVTSRHSQLSYREG